MNKRLIIKILVAILFLVIGYCVGCKWTIGTFQWDLNVNAVDVITLITTIVLGIYIACILEKDVQDRRIEKDMYLFKVSDIETLLNNIETLIEDSNCEHTMYTKVVNLESKCRTKRAYIFKHLLDSANRQIKTKLILYDNNLKTDFKDLRSLLTLTSANKEQEQEVIIKKNIVQYSANRIAEIVNLIDNIENKLLEVRVLVNKM